MTQKVKTQKTTFRIKREFVLWSAIVLLLILQGGTIWYLTQLKKTEKLMSQAHLTMLIRQAEEDRYKSPVIDVEKGRVYIPELRSYLPLNSTTRDLRYNYVAGNSNMLILSLSGVVGHQSDTDDPTCDQMVRLAATTTTSPMQYQATHDTKQCKIYAGHDINALAEAAKMIQQY